MTTPHKLLVFHTAFIGDIILTLPLVQLLHESIPRAQLSFVAVPEASAVLRNHPAVHEVIVYDKRGVDKGLGGILALVSRIRNKRFEIAVVPHRSLRSASIPWLAGIPRRIGFDTSAAAGFFTDVVPYLSGRHEILRNLDLALPLGFHGGAAQLPSLYPNEADRNFVEGVLAEARQTSKSFEATSMIAVAPGSVWNTKRWPAENFSALCRILVDAGHSVVLLGGTGDRQLCQEVARNSGSDRVLNAAGSLTLLQSAEMIRRCRAAVSNDSAPMHLAVSVRTPVIALFGATIPEFGFAPAGEHDRILQIAGLPCRPCGIHGGDVCPIGSFECMTRITPEKVYQELRLALEPAGGNR